MEVRLIVCNEIIQELKAQLEEYKETIGLLEKIVLNSNKQRIKDNLEINSLKKRIKELERNDTD